MSNEVLNPYQTFRDDAGVPVANGTITFNVNLTTTKDTIFSDEALTVAQENPYTLDAYGRIAGDVKYAGLKRLVIKTESGGTVRTLDNVGTSSSDTAAAIAVGKDTEGQDTTLGQTLFTLTTMSYITGTKSLEMRYNGVEYEEGLDWSETTSTTATWINPDVTIAAGGRAVFKKNSSVTSSATLGSNVSFTQAGTGAVAWDVQSKLRESVSIGDFNPFADGTTEDSAAFIKAAILGKPIELEAGKTYLVNTNCPLASGSSFYCVGGVATIKTTSLVSVNLFTGTTLTDIYFENILFDMPDVGSAYTVQPIFITGVTRFKALNCKMTDGTSLMHLFGCIDTWVDRCEADAPDSYGVIFAGTVTNLWVTNGSYHDSVSHDGIKIAGSVTAAAPTHKQIHVYGNTCFNNNRDGIDCAVNDGENIMIHDNVLYDNTISAIEFKLLDTDPVSLKNCKLHDNQINLTVDSSVGISAIAASATSEILMKDIQISNNNITGDDVTTQTGIKLTNILRSSTQNNKVFQCIDAYRYLGCTQGDLTGNSADASGNFVHLSTDGTNAPDGIRIGNNSGQNLVSRFWRVIDASTINIVAFDNKSDAPIDTIVGSVWNFSNGAGGVLDKTASFSVYATHDGTTFTNEGSSVNIAFSLNDVRKGLTYTFIQTDFTKNVDISPPSGVTIGDGAANTDLYLRTSTGSVTIRATSTTHFEIISGSSIVTYETGPNENTATTTQLADISDTVNTKNKYAGRMVYNITTNKPVWSDSSTAADIWVDATGSTAHTPV